MSWIEAGAWNFVDEVFGHAERFVLEDAAVCVGEISGIAHGEDGRAEIGAG
jgi:hypothetical protein